MKSSSFIVLPCLLTILWISTTTANNPPDFYERQYNSLDSNMYLGMATKGLHAFYWKGSFNFTDSTSLVNRLKQPNNIKIAVVDSYYENDMKDMWSHYSQLYQLQHVSFTHVPTFVGTCLTYHVIDDFDMIITLDFSFFQIIRRFKSGRRKSGGEFYNFMDFSSVYLDAPFELRQWVSDNQTTSGEVSFHEGVKCANENINVVTFYEGEVFTNFQIVTRVRNGSLLSDKDLEFLKFVNNINTLKTISPENAEYLKSNISKHYGFDQNSTLEFYQSLFLPNCQCQNDDCISMNFVETDYWIIPTCVLVIGHYLILFCSKSFLTPSLKSRLLMPYLPFITIFLYFNSSNWISQLCLNPRFLIFGFVITFYIAVYSLTILRIYYLRNLYHLLSKNRENIENKLKIQRKLSGPWIGLLFTVVGGFLLSCFFSLPFYFVFINIPVIGFATYANIIVAIYVGIASLIGLFVIGIDLIFNRKKIKEKGLRFLFFFDDPYMIRIELILLSIIIISIIIISAVGQSHVSSFFLLVIYLSMILISGGMSTLKHIANKFLSLARKKSNHSIDDIDVLIQNSNFKDLLHDYCTKEMSLENFNIYIQLREMQEKRIALDLEMMKNIEKNYMALNSLFELNVPSQVRREFYELLKVMEVSGDDGKEKASIELKDQSKSTTRVPLDDLIRILKDPIMQNLGDTLSRLETTKEYEIWNEIYSIQSKTLHQ